MISKIELKQLFTNIRFWIFLFFIVRLVGITNPPLETGHNWRQVITNMVARNMVEKDAQFFYPEIDMAGDLSGISGSEFPFFNWLIYLFSLLFDYSHWLGRLINLVVSSIGIFYFYKLIKSYFSKEIAFNAAIILLASLWFSFSRKIMPDTFSVSLVFIGMYYGSSFLKSNNKLQLLLFFVFTTLGVLCKLPVIYLFGLYILVFFSTTIDNQKKIAIGISLVLTTVLAYIWYFVWVEYLFQTYHYQLFFPKSFQQGLTEIKAFVPATFEQFYFSALRSYLALLFVLVGLVFFFKKEKLLLKSTFLIVVMVFVAFIIKTGNVFPTHNYYVLPFVPVMAFLAAYGLNKVPLKLSYVLLGVIVFEGVLNQQHDFFIKDSEKYKLKLEQIAATSIEKDALIIINGGESPQELYFTNRRGWTVEHSQLLASTFIDSLANRGAAYLILDKKKEPKVTTNYPTIYTDDFFEIIKLKE